MHALKFSGIDIVTTIVFKFYKLTFLLNWFLLPVPFECVKGESSFTTTWTQQSTKDELFLKLIHERE